VSSPVHYQLGNPIEVELSGKKSRIAELEFAAKVFADIEDIDATDGEIPQALELIKRLGKPVDFTLNTLPTWAVDKITLGDGMTIARLVLPRFLG
jgi:hypothetical protein